MGVKEQESLSRGTSVAMKIKLLCLCALVLVFTALGLWLSDMSAIDRCLDHGGSWSHSRDACAFQH
jgi:hypothetical protein